MKQNIKEKNNYIGIFWIINYCLLAKRVNISNIKAIKSFKDSDLSHFCEWDKMNFDIDKYDKYPRGRIVYNINTKQFIIYTAKTIIKNKTYQQMILDFFQIKNNYVFEYDEHYQLTYII